MAVFDLTPRILEIINQRGPTIPRDLVRELRSDSLIMGATLSQLKDSGKLKVSNTKFGGSQFYYVPGQEDQLQKLKDYLTEHDRTTYDLLEKTGVLLDVEQDVNTKLSLRTLKDFAIQINVEYHEQKVVFWKWFLLENETAVEMIKEKLSSIHLIGENEAAAVSKEVPQDIPKQEEPSSETITQIESIETDGQEAERLVELQNTEIPETINKTDTVEVNEDIVKEPFLEKVSVEPKEHIDTSRHELVALAVVKEIEKEQEKKIEETEVFKEEFEEIQPETKVEESITTEIIQKDDLPDEDKPIEVEPIVESTPQKQEFNEAIVEDKLSIPSKSKSRKSFMERVKSTLKDYQADIKAEHVLRKGKEIDYKLSLPTPIGEKDYFCKVKSKSKINEEDLEKLFLKIKSKNLKGLLITDGELTSEASKALSEKYKNIIIHAV